MPVTLIVARAHQGVIGCNNALPWHLPEDLRHFKLTTLGHAVVMGRKTFDAINRALPGRRILVVTRNPHWQHPSCERASSLDEALHMAARNMQGHLDPHAEVFVAGGAQVYAQALAHADRVIVTEIDLDVPDGDARFADLDPAEWIADSRRDETSLCGLRYAIVDWRRRRRAADATA
jgi:dihydrofolate reductase